MRAYPEVLSEQATLDRVCAGESLARYGDGEFTLTRGHGIPCQRFAPALQARLRGILREAGRCLVGIPNLTAASPKAAYWARYGTTAPLLASRPYASAFITRPDSAPWIHTPAYWAQLASLWVGQDVTLVRGSVRSFTAADLEGASRVTEIVGPRTDAWTGYDALLARIGRPARALLCLGPTATVLAVDLCARGVHAIDLGHAGMFLRKARRGEPMIVTDEDRAA
jgi:hypothetical protein